MPISVAGLKALIVAEVGDVDPETGEPPESGVAGIVASHIDSIWDQYQAQDYVLPGLRFYYTLRDCLALVIGVLSPQVDVALNGGEISTRYSQRVATRVQQRASVQAEIERLETKAAAGRAPSIGQLEQTAPVMPADAWRIPVTIDANDPALSGSPYQRVRRLR